MTNFDVLVVYSAAVALSASVADSVSLTPFLIDSNQANYNLSYAYFLETCKKEGLKAAFTTSADITDPGTCQNYWTYNSNSWKKIHSPAHADQIFDKISPTSAARHTERELLLSDKAIKPFNDPELFQLFFDKLLTYKKLRNYGIPTARVASSQVVDIESALKTLKATTKKLNTPKDFSTLLILKDRFGSGGMNVYKIEKDFVPSIQAIMLEHPTVEFILQPFLAFDKGYSHENKRAATDIRLIFQHNTLFQSYLRIAKSDDFRCNEHQGGTLIYVSKNSLPKPILVMSQMILKKLNKPLSLYALDFAVGNSGKVYFIEGNTGPGLDWNTSEKFHEKMSKALIRATVSEFTSRIRRNEFTKRFAFTKKPPVSDKRLYSF